MRKPLTGLKFLDFNLWRIRLLSDLRGQIWRVWWGICYVSCYKFETGDCYALIVCIGAGAWLADPPFHALSVTLWALECVVLAAMIVLDVVDLFREHIAKVRILDQQIQELEREGDKP